MATNDQTAQVVPGVPQTDNQIGVTDFAGQVTTDPSLLLNKDDPATPENESMFLEDHVPTATQEQIDSGQVDPNNPNYQVDPSGTNAQVQTATTSPDVQANTTNQQAAQVTAATTQDNIAQNAQATAAQGQVSTGAQVDPNAIVNDVEATAAGDNGTGAALKQAAQQSMTNIIDTSTMAGKLLAETLGEGNYTDAKATVKGQLDILQGEFFDADGNAKIPSWAAGTARSVSRIAAFRGMTGTAATSALAQAMMEASIPIAQQDAQFFQTLTLENLNNRQEQTINRANVLAKLDTQNMDARLTAAVTNSQHFLKMDLANLDNEQQAEILNTQARVQSILEDAKSENAARLFMADSQNEKDMFYSNLESSIEQFNKSQADAMSQFNAGEVNDVSKFNSELENNRQQFYTNMQFAIDTANAKWRQELSTTENQQKFEAAATDVKNLVGISVEQLNQLWDRADSLLDYAWKTADNTAERQNQIALMKLQSSLTLAAEDKKGWGSILGSVVGAGASALFGWLF